MRPREAEEQGREGSRSPDSQGPTSWGPLKGSSLGLSAYWGSRQEGLWPRVGSVVIVCIHSLSPLCFGEGQILLLVGSGLFALEVHGKSLGVTDLL